MKHVYTLIVKFVMVTIILEVILGMMTNLTFTEILYISAAVTILTYIVGNLLILRLSNNTIATIAEIGLAFVTIISFNYFWYNTHMSYVDALIAVAVIGVGEIFFNRYVATTVFIDTKQSQ